MRGLFNGGLVGKVLFSVAVWWVCGFVGDWLSSSHQVWSVEYRIALGSFLDTSENLRGNSPLYTLATVSAFANYY